MGQTKAINEVGPNKSNERSWAKQKQLTKVGPNKTINEVGPNKSN